ncbi:hypothetical protein D9619_009924 [Psilocybe cf. subviscida]|uniref:Uncharacterized protein n=1 Tax=Psilocybe cf. subviscida TaxID=2480587 RepID=A0A8H5BKI3_9AGAR|nr:hypothetical protein D9619_009924 [Psilocybe cf. subviscida]
MFNATATSSLARLPPELFQLISLALPLSLLSPTLFSLCLTSREVYEKTQRLLYICIVLRHDDASSALFQKIQSFPEIGKIVKELYIHSEVSPAQRRKKDIKSAKFLGGLKDIVERCLLPNLVTIGIFNRSRWSADVDCASLTGDCTLSSVFWANLSSMAPKIRSVIIRNLANDFQLPWVDEEVIDKTVMRKNLISFNMTVGSLGIPTLHGDYTAANHRLFTNLEVMRNCLCTLTLRPVQRHGNTDNATLVELFFPNLRCLELYGFHSSSVPRTSRFWPCHARLERITLWGSTGT